MVRSAFICVHLRLLLVALLVGLTGCEGLAFFSAMRPRKVRKIQKLPDVRTVVLVDDHGDQLGDPALKGVVASNVRFFIMDGKEIKDIVDPQAVTALAARMGKDFDKTPTASIGRQLNAQQVIHVSIESASVASGPGMYRPLAAVQVKVLDVTTGRRIFPGEHKPKKLGVAHDDLATDTFSPHAAAEAPGPGASNDPRGYRFTVRLPAESADNVKHGDPYMLQRNLAQEIGKEVAWLFVDHPAPEAGDQLTRAQRR